MSTQIRDESIVQEPKPPSTRKSPGTPLSEKVRSLRISETETRRRGSSPLLWLLCLALAGSTGYLAWVAYFQPRETNSEKVSVGENSSAGTARSAPVAETGDVVHLAKGYVIPAHQILLSPKVNGMVKWLRVHKPDQSPEEGIPLLEGLRVEKGDILAVLETTDYDADLARTRALLASTEQKLEMERKNIPNEIERAQAELSEAITNRDYLKTLLDRTVALSEKTKAVSSNELQKAQSDFDSGRHRVERLTRALELISGPRAERLNVAEAEVSSARAEFVKAEWRLSNCTISSPVTGTILKKNVEEGNVVNPVAFNGSFSVCEMADLSDLEIELDIQERDVAKVYQGQRCVVWSDAYPDRTYEGYVSRLMPIANRAKGAVPVRVKVNVPTEEQGVYLKPEMGANVKFYRDAARGNAKQQEEADKQSPESQVSGSQTSHE